MKSYLVLFEEKQPHLLNDQLLQDHIQYLKKIDAEGYLKICGPFSDNQKALFIIRSNSRTQADELIQQDPFIQNNYYQAYDVHEFNEASEENNWLVNSTQTLHNLNHEALSLQNYLHDKIQSQSSKNPLCMSVLFRKLNPEQGYADFHQAWLPPVVNISQYFDIPVLVIHGKNVSDPSEIITIGLVWSNVEDAMKGYEKYQKTEEIRHQKIDKITTQSAETRFCKIEDIDVLGS